MVELKVCEHCGKQFVAVKAARRFCSKSCSSSEKRHPHPTLAERFEAKVDRAPDERGCYNWKAGKDARGYGLTSEKGGKKKRAHRAAWELENGPIPNGMNVCHRCDNPSCVNVEHLFLGTQATNLEDMTTKGRRYCGDRVSQQMRGNRHAKRKLGDRQIELIRDDPRSSRMIGADYGVSHEFVLRIKRGRILAGTKPRR